MYCDAQQWTPWTSIQDGQENAVQYSYLITKCKYDDGSNFNFKIRSDYKAKICGKIKVVIQTSSGASKSLEYEFKNLDANERTCYGIQQICGTNKLISVSKVNFAKCQANEKVKNGVSELEFKKAKQN